MKTACENLAEGMSLFYEIKKLGSSSKEKYDALKDRAGKFNGAAESAVKSFDKLPEEFKVSAQDVLDEMDKCREDVGKLLVLKECETELEKAPSQKAAKEGKEMDFHIYEHLV